jgi:hypothetical protein
MRSDGWYVCGYVGHWQTRGATVCTPVLKRHSSEQLYLQIDFQCPPPRFGLYPVADNDTAQIVPVDRKECDPTKHLIVFVLHGGSAVYGNLEESVAQLERIVDSDAASASARIQIREMLGGLSHSDAFAEISNLIPEKEFRYFSAAMSADAIFQITMKKLRPQQDRAEAVNIVRNALRVIHNWRIDKSKISELKPLLEITGLTFGEFSAALNSRQPNLLPRASVDEQIEDAWKSIRRLSRQERRLARLLRIYVGDPKLATRVLEVYTTPNYLETRALSEINRMVQDEQLQERHRALQVAHFIPRLVTMEFGAQRGKLLYDLALELGGIPEIRNVLELEFRRRGHTWTVGSWAQEFNEALEDA